MAYEIKYRSEDEMKDSGIEWLGKVPKEWQVKKLKYLTNSVKNGIWGEEEKGDRHDIPCVRITNFNRYNNKVELNDLTIRNLNKYKQKEYLLSRNDLLIEKSGGGEYQPVGFVTLYTSDKPAIYANFMAKISINKKNSNLYLLYYFRNLYDRRINKKYINQTTGIQNIDVTSYFNEKVAIPYLNDQQKIANFLDIKTAEFDSIISKKEQLIEKLVEAKKSLISEVITGKVKIVDGQLVDRKPEEMKDSGVEWLGMIPKDWEVKKIKHNTYVKGRIGWQGLRADEFTDEGPYLVTGTDFLNKSINWNNCYHISEKRYKEAPAIHLKDGDLLITKDGSIGKLAIVENCPDKAILNSGIFVTRCTNGEYLTEFMFYILSSNIFNIYIGLMTTGSTILHLYQSTFVNFIYPLPNIDIQSKLIQYLDNETNKINSIITKTQKQISKLKEAKQSLISEAVTGKIDLRDWEIIETGGR